MSWRWRRFTLVLIGVLLGLVAAGLVIYGFQLDSNAGACSSYEPGETSCGGGPGDVFIEVPPFVFVGGIMVLAFGPTAFRAITRRRVSRTGRDATATVLWVADTGTTVNYSPQVRIGLTVAPSDGSPPYTTELTTLVSRLSVPHSGDVLRVRYDPAHPKTVALIGAAPQVPSVSWQMPSPVSAQPAGQNTATELARLDALHASGTLTDAEYETLKQNLTQGEVW